MAKRQYWQAIRGMCILAVIMIHSLGGFDSTSGTVLLVLRQLINFAVAIFIFMSGYFVSVNKFTAHQDHQSWLMTRGGRLLTPFVIWSIFYSGIAVLQNILAGEQIHWLGVIYRFAVGKAATPFYYIIALFQLTVITPWLCNIIQSDGKDKVKKLLWLVTPAYLAYIYLWNFLKGSTPFLYETFFPAWFVFYYLGLQVKCGKVRIRCGFGCVLISLLLSCIEALTLRRLGMATGFYTSQITVGSFLFSIAIIGWILKIAEMNKGSDITQKKGMKLLAKVGDCSYGMFYIHVFVLMLAAEIAQAVGITGNWWLYDGFRFMVAASAGYIIVRATQLMLRKRQRLLQWFGLI